MRTLMVLMGLLLGGCQSAPEDRLAWRESWELLALLEDRQLVDARVVVGNTGLLRGQAQLKMDRWTRRETPLRFVQHAAPVAVHRDPGGDGISLTGNGLRREDGVWSLRVADTNVNALLRLEPPAAEVVEAPVASWTDLGGHAWESRALVMSGTVSGWMAAGERGGLVRGTGLLLHRSGEGWPEHPRQAAFVLTRDVQLGVDVQGEGRLAWAWIDGTRLPLEDLQVLPAETGGGLVLDLRPAVALVATFSPGKGGGQTRSHEHLTPPEQWLLALGRGPITRSVQEATVEIWHDGQQRRVPGILLKVSRAP